MINSATLNEVGPSFCENDQRSKKEGKGNPLTNPMQTSQQMLA